MRKGSICPELKNKDEEKRQGERAQKKREEEMWVPYMCQGFAGGSVLVEVSLDHTHSLFHPHSSQRPMLSLPKQIQGRK